MRECATDVVMAELVAEVAAVVVVVATATNRSRPAGRCDGWNHAGRGARRVGVATSA
jgi:hypothetical protein